MPTIININKYDFIDKILMIWPQGKRCEVVPVQSNTFRPINCTHNGQTSLPFHDKAFLIINILLGERRAPFAIPPIKSGPHWFGVNEKSFRLNRLLILIAVISTGKGTKWWKRRCPMNYLINYPIILVRTRRKALDIQMWTQESININWKTEYDFFGNLGSFHCFYYSTVLNFAKYDSENLHRCVVCWSYT